MQPGNGSIGFIGLGVMGGPMAANLMRAGYDVVGYNRSTPAMDRLREVGGAVATDAADVAARCDVVITMLPDDAAVSAVYDEALLPKLRPDVVLVDMSTVSPALSRDIAARADAGGAAALDAPVSGGEQGAIEASLSVMVGGDRATFERMVPVFQAVGKTIHHVGDAGAGQTVKAANQLLVGGIIELVSEAILFLEAHGIEHGPALEVLSGGLAGNSILERKAAGMVAREFKPGFRIDLHHKDMGILMSAARDANLPLPLAAIVAQLFAASRARGDGGLDHSALLRNLEALVGR
jgi:2-hydroxy-3-oxopropionate reductase